MHPATLVVSATLCTLLVAVCMAAPTAGAAQAAQIATTRPVERTGVWTPLPPQSGVADADGKTIWYDAKLLGIEGKGWDDGQYTRLPAKAKGVVRPDVWRLAADSAGLSVRFVVAGSFSVRWAAGGAPLAMPHMPATGVSGIDAYRWDGSVGRFMFVGNGRPEGGNLLKLSCPAEAEWRIYLPLYNGTTSLKIGVPPGVPIYKLPIEPLSRGLVFYGTSITQGGCASRPGLAAPTIVGRALGCPVVNLGFSGNGRMEPALADLLGELDPAVFVIDCGWNMGTGEAYAKAVEPFVKKVRTTRPDTPIVVVESCTVGNKPREGEQLCRVVDALRQKGDRNIHFMPNANMLGDDREGTVDGLHPNDLGMSRQADAFVRFLRENKLVR